MSEGTTYQGFVPGRHEIESYGAGGFRFADMSHRGSILVLPSGIRSWLVSDAREIDETTLVPVFEEVPNSIQLLLIGTGVRMVPLKPALRTRLRAAGIGVDTMNTGAAVATYNILLSEKRLVAAALVASP